MRDRARRSFLERIRQRQWVANQYFTAVFFGSGSSHMEFRLRDSGVVEVSSSRSAMRLHEGVTLDEARAAYRAKRALQRTQNFTLVDVKGAVSRFDRVVVKP